MTVPKIKKGNIVMTTSGVSGLSGNCGSIPEKQQRVEQESNQNNKSIFLYKDKDGDEHVNAADFDNNQALINIADHNGWLNKTWENVGESLNRLLKFVNPEKIQSEIDVLNEMVENIDSANEGDVAATLTALGNELYKHTINDEQYDNYIKAIFKDNLLTHGVYRGGRHTDLKDGTTIEQHSKLPSLNGMIGDNNVVFKHPDGTETTYTDEGKKIE